ncbi:MAG: polymerase subunit alpha, partial [Bacilli bacterium]|nr:polymerase subunit alpha [Bacilli bacterium]
MTAIHQPAYLRIRSEYSLLQSTLKMDELVRRAKQRGADVLALTDVGNLHGVVAFYKACRNHHVHPIIGVELQLVNFGGSSSDSRVPAYPVILLAESQQGYRNLLQLVTKANLEGASAGAARIEWQWLTGCAGILALTAWEEGYLAAALTSGSEDLAREYLLRLQNAFGPENVFVEVQERGRLQDRALNQQLVALARQSGAKLVATQTISCLSPDDYDALLTLEAIRLGSSLEEVRPARVNYVGTEMPVWDEWIGKFRYLPEAIASLDEIAGRCKVEISLGETHLPVFPYPESFASADDYLRHLVQRAACERYPHADPASEHQQEILRRMDDELRIISQLGFASYFLIVWDFMSFAHENGITTGPGRGSAAGSLVAYLLRITDVDPLKYGLLMERFLNPERVSWPDIDIDFEYERRTEVITYVTNRYGKDRVAQITTFGTLAARAAIRDVGRVLGKSQADIDRLAKAIPAHLGITLEQAMTGQSGLKEWVSADAKLLEWYTLAGRIEGLPRHTSIHAAGVVISANPLTEYTALQLGPDEAPVTQLAMEDVEAVGLLKMDFLGLRTLTLIDRALLCIEQRHGTRINWDTDMEDPLTYRLLARGLTDGCFQLESSGVKLVLRELKPTAFEDIIAVISLYRPGPMENIPHFIKAKHGQIPIVYPHPSLAPILKDTYGVIVYQEQIMQIASFMAGFSLGQADVLRRAVGKKKREILDEQRALFVQGSARNGYDSRVADDVYDLIVRFADYGFNRSHAAAYGVLAYRTAYLKAHYPAEFMASLMSLWMGNPGKLSQYAEEARRLGLQIAPPDVNASGGDFSAVNDPDGHPSPSIRFGLSAVRHMGTAAVQALLLEREKSGPFSDFFDLCKRIDTRVVNRRTIESLIRAGAFDRMGQTRRALLAGLDEVLQSAAVKRESRNQLSLFEMSTEVEQEQEVILPLDEFPAAELLELEKETLGVYVTGHPLDAYRTAFMEYGCQPLGEIPLALDKGQANYGGRVARIKQVQTKKGQAMCFAELEDFTGTAECILFPETWSRVRQWLAKDVIVLIKASVKGSGDEAKLIVETAEPASAENAQSVELNRPTELTDQVNPTILAQKVTHVYLRIDPARHGPAALTAVKEQLAMYPGEAVVRLV